MSFTIPKLGTAPTVADTDEGAAPSETGMTSTYDTVTVNKFAGLNRISWELIDRSSPAFMELLMTELRKAYEKSTDAALIAAFTASGTAATGVAATAAGLQSFISVESAAAYKNTGGDFANKLVASTDQWAAISGYADTTGRALYSAQGQTMNASGAVVPTSVVGNVLGTSLIVDHNIAVSGIVDESAFLVAPRICSGLGITNNTAPPQRPNFRRTRNRSLRIPRNRCPQGWRRRSSLQPRVSEPKSLEGAVRALTAPSGL